MRYHRGKVLDVEADALVVTIDGSSKESMGHVASRLLERMEYGDHDELDFPIPLGEVKILTVKNPDFRFRVVFLLSAVDYDKETTSEKRKGLVLESILAILKEGAEMGLESVACPPMGKEALEKADELCESIGIALVVCETRTEEPHHEKRSSNGSGVGQAGPSSSSR